MDKGIGLLIIFVVFSIVSIYSFALSPTSNGINFYDWYIKKPEAVRIVKYEYEEGGDTYVVQCLDRGEWIQLEEVSNVITGYMPIYCDTFEQAEKVLNQFIRRRFKKEKITTTAMIIQKRE